MIMDEEILTQQNALHYLGDKIHNWTFKNLLHLRNKHRLVLPIKSFVEFNITVMQYFSLEKCSFVRILHWFFMWRVCAAWEDWMIRVSKWEGNNITDKLRGYFHILEGCSGYGCTTQTCTLLKNKSFRGQKKVEWSR